VIPLVDLQAQHAPLRRELDDALRRVIDGGQFILGDEVARFETAFAAYAEVAHAVGVASGTAALQLALVAAGIRPGDEVITSALTFIATVEAIVHAGARPVLVDIDPLTCTIDPRGLAAAITPRTRAIVPVHLYGRPADLTSIGAVAAAHDLSIIEDAAQAHGARWRGQRVGGIGRAGCFSFFPGKNLGGFGDGGMVVTNDAALASRVRALRDHGRSTSRHEHALLGYGERLDALQAAVLGVKLPHLDDWNARRRRIADRYRAVLAPLDVGLPADDGDATPVYHQFVIRVRQRDRVRARLHADGIAAGVHYPIPVHRQAACQGIALPPAGLPEAERAATEVLSLPMYPELTDDHVQRVATALQNALRG
jgi:dTDP-4-amino-4,6-dideoxygalactose transaminase